MDIFVFLVNYDLMKKDVFSSRKPVLDLAESLLTEPCIRQFGNSDPPTTHQKGREQLNGRRKGQYPLWGERKFHSWREEISR